MIRRERIIWATILALGLGGHAAAGTLYRCAGGADDPVNYASHPVAGMKCKAISYTNGPSPKKRSADGSSSAPLAQDAGAGLHVSASPIPPVPEPVETVAIPAASGSPALSDVDPLLHQRAQIASANAVGTLPLTTGHAGSRVSHKTLYKYTDAEGVVHLVDEIHKPSGVKGEVIDSHTETCSDAIHCQETGFDTIGPYSYANLIGPCYACGALPGVNFGRIALNTTAYAAEISTAAHAYGVDEWLIRAIIHAESNYNPNALSYKGAEGLMQLMPGTAARFGVANAFAAADNISGGVQYLAFLSRRYNGDVRLIAAAYNAGEASVDRYGGVPPFAETLRYVDRVGTLAERYRGAK
ncbi:MAG TPA: lytic transglycosylase domain-containing protein [Xanthomonadaceae bacterium]|nr:lytic transglycosylase domain-containing protein [Xanthomonadaceae bacterium]